MASKKFHVNPETGKVNRCSTSPEKCRYGQGVEENHYDTKAEAQEASLTMMANRFETIQSHHKEDKSTQNHSKKIEKRILENNLIDCMDGADAERLQELVDESRKSWKVADSLVVERGKRTMANWELLWARSPLNRKPMCPYDEETYASLARNHESYRRTTTMLVEALTESPHFKQKYDIDANFGPIGDTVPITQLEDGDTNFIPYCDTITASDVGLFALHDFIAYPKNPRIKQLFNRMEQIKAQGIPKRFNNDEAGEVDWRRKARRYQEAVWGPRLLNDYAKFQQGKNRVVKVNQQYVNPEHPWQVIDLNNVVCDKDSNTPVGLLETRVASSLEWASSIPTAYRIRGLYYLYVTNLDELHINVSIQDSLVKRYYLRWNYEIYPGHGNIERYIKHRVLPWFENLKSQR